MRHRPIMTVCGIGFVALAGTLALVRIVRAPSDTPSRGTSLLKRSMAIVWTVLLGTVRGTLVNAVLANAGDSASCPAVQGE